MILPVSTRLLGIALVLAACGPDEPAPGGGTASADSAPAAPADSAAWTVTPRGAGPVRVGMTVAEALGRPAAAPADSTACEYVWSSSVPAGVKLMSVGGRVARVEVDSGAVATAEGARIGDTEARVRELYAGRVTAQPHKYTDGRYLVVTPAAPADSAHRIVFETDGARVLRYRAGVLPQVEWVEGCS